MTRTCAACGPGAALLASACRCRRACWPGTGPGSVSGPGLQTADSGPGLRTADSGPGLQTGSKADPSAPGPGPGCTLQEGLDPGVCRPGPGPWTPGRAPARTLQEGPGRGPPGGPAACRGAGPRRTLDAPRPRTPPALPSRYSLRPSAGRATGTPGRAVFRRADGGPGSTWLYQGLGSGLKAVQQPQWARWADAGGPAAC